MGKSVFVCELFFEFRPEILQGNRSRRAEQRYYGTFSISPLSPELFTLENLAKIAVLHAARLITFEPLDRFE